MSDNPQELLYTREHEWVRIDGEKGVIGITEYAQKSLGDIVYVELPALDDEIDAGDEFGTIESVKAVSSLYMPISGTITDVNSDLRDEPEIINEDCFGDGWLVRVIITNPDEIDGLLSADDYDTFLIEEED